MAGMGHEDAFPPTTLSNRSRLGKPAGTRGNEQDAPKADLVAGSSAFPGSTPSRHLATSYRHAQLPGDALGLVGFRGIAAGRAHLRQWQRFRA